MQVINNIFNLFRGLINVRKRVDLKKLPSQGKFYDEDFELKIKKAELEDIIEYEQNYDKENIYLVVESLKGIVRKNTILSNGYVFEDIKSVDLVFLFLEIVKYTTKKPINISFFNHKIGKEDFIEFDTKNFNYFDFSKYIFDEESKEILINGYRFSMPSIGLENCMTFYLAHKINDGFELKNYFFDFLFFTGNKNFMSKDELENLFIIFNYDIEESERRVIKEIVDNFVSIVGYTLNWEGEVVELKSKIDLETIWKHN